MSTQNTGGPAFPVLDYITPEKVATYNNGMTLRDYFAAKAMQAVLSRADRKGNATEYAAIAYEMADAMLKVREA